MELHETLEAVYDWQTFLTFARHLRTDREVAARIEKAGPDSVYGGANGWQNLTIETFLGGAIAWAEETLTDDTKEFRDNPWKQFAVFLYCGKIYE